MHYRFTWPIILEALWCVLWGVPRNVAYDAGRILAHLKPTPLVTGTENIPPTGPLIILPNHYQRPGLWVIWGSILIIKAMHQCRPSSPIHWVMTTEWREQRLGPFLVPARFSRWFLKRAAHVIGGILMPFDDQPTLRLKAVREVTRILARPGGNGVVGLYPEGPVAESRLEAKTGAGSLLFFLAQRNVRLLPVGVSEVQGRLVANFGPPLQLCAPGTQNKGEQDTELGRQVMESIGRLLPVSTTGDEPKDTSPKARH